MARAAKSSTKAAASAAKPKKRAGAKASALSVSDEDAKAQLEAFIDNFDPAIAALARKAIAYMRKRLPGALVTIYDNYNALGVGFGPEGKKAVLSVVLYPSLVRFFFLRGAGLDDPHRLMEGKGSTVRSIRLTDMALLKNERVDALITAAVLHAGWRLDPKGKGHMEVRMALKDTRPRRLG
jgi:hypothetical protein